VVEPTVCNREVHCSRLVWGSHGYYKKCSDDILASENESKEFCFALEDSFSDFAAMKRGNIVPDIGYDVVPYICNDIVSNIGCYIVFNGVLYNGLSWARYQL
jgi:hypothetical protein